MCSISHTDTWLPRKYSKSSVAVAGLTLSYPRLQSRLVWMTKRNQFTDRSVEIDWFVLKEAVKTTFLDIFKMKVTRSGKTK